MAFVENIFRRLLTCGHVFLKEGCGTPKQLGFVLCCIWFFGVALYLWVLWRLIYYIYYDLNNLNRLTFSP
jgi:hypothetical protein